MSQHLLFSAILGACFVVRICATQDYFKEETPALQQAQPGAHPGSGDGGASLGYGDGPAYWDDRYTNNPETFEWLADYTDIVDYITEGARGNRSSRILQVGCGTSQLSERIYDDGYHNITNIDTSSVVINQKSAQNTERPGLRWMVMDATRMTFADESFDLVVDKSVLDTFACMDNSDQVADTYLKEVLRVLKPGAMFLCVSFGDPSSRLNFLQQPHLNFALRHETIPGEHVYIGKKSLEPSFTLTASHCLASH